jgi:hypothetical protein
LLDLSRLCLAGLLKSTANCGFCRGTHHNFVPSAGVISVAAQIRVLSLISILISLN